VLEGRGGHSYVLHVRSPRQLGEVSGAKLEADENSTPRLLIAFDGAADAYIRRELTIPLRRKKR
jgi:hypothetical protein